MPQEWRAHEARANRRAASVAMYSLAGMVKAPAGGWKLEQFLVHDFAVTDQPAAPRQSEPDPAADQQRMLAMFKAMEQGLNATGRTAFTVTETAEP